MTRLVRIAILFAALAVGAAPASAAFRPGAPQPVDLAAVVVSDAKGDASLAEVVAGKPTILHVWATWCGPCRTELPAVARFQAALAAEGLGDRLVLLSVDRSSHARVAAFLADDLGLDLHTWFDSGRKAGPVLRLFGYPATVVLDGDGAIVWRHTGPLDWDDPSLRDALTRYLTPAGQ